MLKKIVTYYKNLDKTTYKILYKGLEFCFLLGQVSYYLISHSKAEKLTQNVFEPIINASKLDVVKKELNILRRKYAHEIGLNNKRFNKAFNEILAYETDKKLKENEIILLIGLLADNLFYEKKGENEDYENE